MIHELPEKIKHSWIGYKETLFLFGIIFLGVVAGGGVLYMYNNRLPQASVVLQKNTFTLSQLPIEERHFFASRYGTVYYTRTCRDRTRILPKNMVWFRSSENAEKAGYAPAQRCH